jgi:uncharacterized coiled-coil protein SlyX
MSDKLPQKKPIQEISQCLSEISKDISVLKNDLSYIKEKIKQQEIKRKLEDQKIIDECVIEAKSWWFG